MIDTAPTTFDSAVRVGKTWADALKELSAITTPIAARHRLHEAAPCMLKALKRAEQTAVDDCPPEFDPEQCRCDEGHGYCNGCTLVEIRAAIAKAEGRDTAP